MKTASEYKNYEQDVLMESDLYDYYYDKWSVYWFKTIFKPIFDYCYTAYDYYEEQNFLLPHLKLIYDNSKLIKYKKKDFTNPYTELYNKLKKSSKKLKKLFPNMILVDEDYLKEICDSKYISFKKMKDISKENNPYMNFFSRSDCSFLLKNPNMSENIVKKYPQYKWNLENNEDVHFFYPDEFYKEDYSNLELNFNLTPEKIKKNKCYHWNIKGLAQNDFTVMRVQWIDKHIKEGKLGSLRPSFFSKTNL